MRNTKLKTTKKPSTKSAPATGVLYVIPHGPAAGGSAPADTTRARRFVERTVDRLVRLEQPAELEYLLDRLSSTFTTEERSFALVQLADGAAPDTLAKIVSECAAICGCADDEDGRYEAEAALVRLGHTPARAADIVQEAQNRG
jgi:hypothetical protein